MSRVSRYGQGNPSFYMECDESDCDVSEGPAASEEALSLRDFRDQGWFIAQHWGDCCPNCVKAGRAEGRAPMPETWFGYPSLYAAQKLGLYDVTNLGSGPVRAI
jgi:hypothetical protein